MSGEKYASFLRLNNNKTQIVFMTNTRVEEY